MSAISDQLAYEIAVEGWSKRELTNSIVAHGFAADDQDVRAKVKTIKNKIKNRQEMRYKGCDPLLHLRDSRKGRADYLRKTRELGKGIEKLISTCPISKYWRSDRLEMVKATYTLAEAHRLAIKATLEALARISAKWGFTRRHTSASRGSADSRYLLINGTGWTGEVRISNHYIPETNQRTHNREMFGGPSWGEVIVTDLELKWSVTRWKRELILCAAGRR